MPAIPIAELGHVTLELVDDDRMVLGAFVKLDAHDGGPRLELEDDHAVRFEWWVISVDPMLGRPVP